MVGVVCSREGCTPYFDQSAGQDVRGRENGSLPAYLSKSTQAFLPEFVGSWNHVQGLPVTSPISRRNWSPDGGTPHHRSHLIQEVHETENVRTSQSRHEVPISFEMEKVVENATRFRSRQIQFEETIENVGSRHDRVGLGRE